MPVPVLAAVSAGREPSSHSPLKSRVAIFSHDQDQDILKDLTPEQWDYLRERVAALPQLNCNNTDTTDASKEAEPRLRTFGFADATARVFLDRFSKELGLETVDRGVLAGKWFKGVRTFMNHVSAFLDSRITHFKAVDPLGPERMLASKSEPLIIESRNVRLSAFADATASAFILRFERILRGEQVAEKWFQTVKDFTTTALTIRPALKYTCTHGSHTPEAVLSPLNSAIEPSKPPQTQDLEIISSKSPSPLEHDTSHPDPSLNSQASLPKSPETPVLPLAMLQFHDIFCLAGLSEAQWDFLGVHLAKSLAESLFYCKQVCSAAVQKDRRQSLLVAESTAVDFVSQFSLPAKLREAVKRWLLFVSAPERGAENVSGEWFSHINEKHLAVLHARLSRCKAKFSTTLDPRLNSTEQVVDQYAHIVTKELIREFPGDFLSHWKQGTTFWYNIIHSVATRWFSAVQDAQDKPLPANGTAATFRTLEGPTPQDTSPQFINRKEDSDSMPLTQSVAIGTSAVVMFFPLPHGWAEDISSQVREAQVAVATLLLSRTTHLQLLSSNIRLTFSKFSASRPLRFATRALFNAVTLAAVSPTGAGRECEDMLEKFLIALGMVYAPPSASREPANETEVPEIVRKTFAYECLQLSNLDEWEQGTHCVIDNSQAGSPERILDLSGGQSLVACGCLLATAIASGCFVPDLVIDANGSNFGDKIEERLQEMLTLPVMECWMFGACVLAALIGAASKRGETSVNPRYLTFYHQYLQRCSQLTPTLQQWTFTWLSPERMASTSPATPWRDLASAAMEGIGSNAFQIESGRNAEDLPHSDTPDSEEVGDNRRTALALEEAGSSQSANVILALESVDAGKTAPGKPGQIQMDENEVICVERMLGSDGSRSCDIYDDFSLKHAAQTSLTGHGQPCGGSGLSPPFFSGLSPDKGCRGNHIDGSLVREPSIGPSLPPHPKPQPSPTSHNDDPEFHFASADGTLNAKEVHVFSPSLSELELDGKCNTTLSPCFEESGILAIENEDNLWASESLDENIGFKPFSHLTFPAQSPPKRPCIPSAVVASPSSMPCLGSGTAAPSPSCLLLVDEWPLKRKRWSYLPCLSERGADADDRMDDRASKRARGTIPTEKTSIQQTMATGSGLRQQDENVGEQQAILPPSCALDLSPTLKTSRPIAASQESDPTAVLRGLSSVSTSNSLAIALSVNSADIEVVATARVDTPSSLGMNTSLSKPTIVPSPLGKTVELGSGFRPSNDVGEKRIRDFSGTPEISSTLIATPPPNAHRILEPSANDDAMGSKLPCDDTVARPFNVTQLRFVFGYGPGVRFCRLCFAANPPQDDAGDALPDGMYLFPADICRKSQEQHIRLWHANAVELLNQQDATKLKRRMRGMKMCQPIV